MRLMEEMCKWLRDHWRSCVRIIKKDPAPCKILRTSCSDFFDWKPGVQGKKLYCNLEVKSNMFIIFSIIQRENCGEHLYSVTLNQHFVEPLFSAVLADLVHMCPACVKSYYLARLKLHKFSHYLRTNFLSLLKKSRPPTWCCHHQISQRGWFFQKDKGSC